MAKLNNYTGSVELPSGLTARNKQDFPLMEAHSVVVDENGTRLDGAIDILTAALPKVYVKAFVKEDFVQVGSAQRYCLQIPRYEHNLEMPYVDKMIVTQTDDESTFQSNVSVGERLLSTGTIKIYITIDLSKYDYYSGKIYLKGE